jgi:hypothetical protein
LALAFVCAITFCRLRDHICRKQFRTHAYCCTLADQVVPMRIWTLAGIAIALLSGSASAQTDVAYRSVQEICLFSPFLAPADSPLALRTLKPFGDTAGGDDRLDDFKISLASGDPNLFRPAGSPVIAAATPPKRVFVSLVGDWGSTRSDMSARILGAVSDWTNFALNGGGDRTSDETMTFGVSSVPAAGLEHNGYVAGFNFKF